jgi:choline dehydrogenase-like flavoprotein
MPRKRLSAGPGLAAPAVQPDFDVVIVGAGAAGIAAARRIAVAGRSYVVLEASDRWGGRCFTDMRTFRIPMSAGRVGSTCPMSIPWRSSRSRRGSTSTRYGRASGCGSAAQRARERSGSLASLVRCNRGISDATRGKVDVSCVLAYQARLGIFALLT